jgi:hypothetical protein
VKTNKSKAKSSKSSKNGKAKTAKKAKKLRSTGGFPQMIAVTRTDNNDGTTSFDVHPIDFGDINADTEVAIFRFRRVVNVQVSRKIKRVPKEHT